MAQPHAWLVTFTIRRPGLEDEAVTDAVVLTEGTGPLAILAAIQRDLDSCEQVESGDIDTVRSLGLAWTHARCYAANDYRIAERSTDG